MNLRRLLALTVALALLLPAAATAAPAPSVLAGPCLAGGSYDPACDVDHNGVIDVLDIQLTAGRWNTNGVWTADGWSLTGNAGTTPGTNFLGTTDNQSLELRVNGSRALLIQHDSSGRPNIIGGHSENGATAGVYAATIGGGGGSSSPNWVYDDYSTVGGGTNNMAGSNDGATESATGATVGGGSGNSASGAHTTIAGGNVNIASGNWATIAGGSGNTASGLYAAVPGGNANTASGNWATVAGGSANTAGGLYAAVPGGIDNLAGGNYSFAAGRHAKTNAAGAFVWADSNDFNFAPGVANAFSARTTGGFRIYLGIDGTGGTTWQCTVYNGGSWGCSSDRDVKENFQPVNGQEVLQRLMTVPITTWNAIGTDPAVRRMGPMAQDFYAAFGLGDDDKVITTGDLDGVALASIQGLYQMVQEKDAQLAAQQGRLLAQQAQIDSLAARLAALEQNASTAP